MKRFIKCSILFAAIIAALLGCCELMVRNSPNTYTLKKNWMISHSGGIKTLITGNSHSYYGIKPDAIGDSVVVFTLAGIVGFAGQTFVVEVFLLRTGDCSLHGAGFDWVFARGAFGGNIYTYGGSHGCVNLPLDIAAQLYNLVYVGMPVIVHN